MNQSLLNLASANKIFDILQTETPDTIECMSFLFERLAVINPTLTSKLHVILANTTCDLLKHQKQETTDATNSIQSALMYDQIKKFKTQKVPDNLSIVVWMFPFIRALFPSAKIGGHSEIEKKAFIFFLDSFKAIYIEDILSDFWFEQRLIWFKLLIRENINEE
jgi:hypothetical protein